MTYRLIDGEIHKRNRDGHYMPLTVAEAAEIVRVMNAWSTLAPGADLTAFPQAMVEGASKLLDQLEQLDHSDHEPPKDSQ